MVVAKVVVPVRAQQVVPLVALELVQSPLVLLSLQRLLRQLQIIRQLRPQLPEQLLPRRRRRLVKLILSFSEKPG